jgi:hypothetical protein
LIEEETTELIKFQRFAELWKGEIREMHFMSNCQFTGCCRSIKRFGKK